jgi:hypothetical protein
MTRTTLLDEVIAKVNGLRAGGLVAVLDFLARMIRCPRCDGPTFIRTSKGRVIGIVLSASAWPPAWRA